MTNFLQLGKYTEISEVKQLKKCILRCCVNQECNVAFMNDDKCYHIHCNSNELCMPKRPPDPELYNHITMVLVKPILSEESWEDLFRQQGKFNNFHC